MNRTYSSKAGGGSGRSIFCRIDYFHPAHSNYLELHYFIPIQDTPPEIASETAAAHPDAGIGVLR
ncbi:MAG: hypothetical protein M0Q13_08015 [Methanothrix sp.]|jgi:hypothetical protein|nr:hypothetical protein [Methanothrix sp.]